MKSFSGLIAGYDPGGDHKHGLAILTIESGACKAVKTFGPESARRSKSGATLHSVRDVLTAAKCRLVIEQALDEKVTGFREGYANLFPAIHKLYDDKEAGRVVDMSCQVPTGSTKSEKMRKKSTCLRDEAFHVGGVNAVNGKIEPYSIALAWQPNNSKLPRRELQIHGGVRDLHSTNPSINYFIAKNCAEEPQLNQMIKLVRKYATNA